jgi:hypothetical protein
VAAPPHAPGRTDPTGDATSARSPLGHHGSDGRRVAVELKYLLRDLAVTVEARYLIFRSRARRTCGATTSSKTSHGSSYCEPKTPQTMASPSRLQTTRTTGRAETVNGWLTRRSGSARVALSRGLFNGPPTQAPAPCADRVGHRACRQVRDRMARLQRRQRRALRNVSLFGCRRVIGWVRGPAAATANAGPARAVPRGRLLV